MKTLAFSILFSLLCLGWFRESEAHYLSHRLTSYGSGWSGAGERVSNGPHVEITARSPLATTTDLIKRSVVVPEDDYYLLFTAFGLAKNEVVVNAKKLSAELAPTFKLEQGNALWTYHSSPVAKGGVARRYGDETMETAQTWIEKYEYYEANQPGEVAASQDLNMLSPIEKYELLMGHEDFPLTIRSWSEGKEFYQRYNTVPGWIGACHGTAPAAIRHDRPARSVFVKSYRAGKTIEFTPADIKMLLSHAWAVYGGFSAMVGTRCGGGGISCFDTNPPSFHISLLNMLGKQKRPLIIDASSQEEVWNRPLVGYRVRFLDPRTGIVVSSIDKALVSLKDYTNDPHREMRSAKAKYVVGVWTKVTYVDDRAPTLANTDSAQEDIFAESSYQYDLELDENYNIVGGEWDSDYHPDFMWVVNDKIEPFAPQDAQASELLWGFNGSRPVSSRVHELSKSAASKGLVLFSVLKRLHQLSL